MTKDRTGYLSFLEHTAELLESIDRPGKQEPVIEKRIVHTIKGDTSIFGLDRMAAACHSVEDQLSEDEGATLNQEQCDELIAEWRATRERLASIIGNTDAETVDVSPNELKNLSDMIRKGGSSERLLEVIASYAHESIDTRRPTWAQLSLRYLALHPAIAVVAAIFVLMLPEDTHLSSAVSNA